RRRRHNLFAQQRAAAAFDNAEIGANLVGTVDRHVERRRFVERGQRHTELLGLLACCFGGRDAHDPQAATHALRQKLDEMPGRRAGAQAKPHAWPHPFHCNGSGLTFLCFNVHERAFCKASGCTRVYTPKDSRKTCLLPLCSTWTVPLLTLLLT